MISLRISLIIIKTLLDRIFSLKHKHIFLTTAVLDGTLLAATYVLFFPQGDVKDSHIWETKI